MKKHIIQSDIDLQHSREYYGAYNSRDFYKGTSFKMAGEWMSNIHYFNDEYVIDFVAFNGALLSCTQSHISSASNAPELIRKDDQIIGIKPNQYWTFVMSGTEGPEGKMWIPSVSDDGTITWTKSDTPIDTVQSANIKGPQGVKGDPGSSPELRITVNKDTGRSILETKLPEASNWNQLGEVGGMPGKSPKLIRTFGDPNTSLDDRILWGYDGIPVSEWTVLCYVDELRGDENIAIGCPSDFEGGAPPIDKIWYDPCDYAVDQFSASDFLYESYKQIGGTLSKEEFEKKFAEFPQGTGSGTFETILVDSLDDLGAPTIDKVGKIYFVLNNNGTIIDPEKPVLNAYDEYICIFVNNAYLWERIGHWNNIPESVTNTWSTTLDSSITTPFDVGGIAAGTKVSDLAGKSYDYIIEQLLFPVVNPTFVSPSASISLNNYSAAQEIGATAPTDANFNTSFNAGAIKLSGVTQSTRSGDLISGTILYSSNKVSTLPTTVISGAMDYYYRASYAKGPQPKNSRGENYDSPLAAGSVDSGKVTVTGYRPAYYGLVTTTDITADVLKSLTKKISAKQSITVKGPIEEKYICLAVPSGWTVSNIKDSNNFDVTSSYEKKTLGVTCLDGQTVTYTVYLSSKMSQPETYYVIFN